MLQSRLRILALVTDAYASTGGIAQYNRDLLEALSASTEVDRIVVLARLGETVGVAVPSKVRALTPSSSRSVYSARALSAAFRQGPFDVVLCGHILIAPLAHVIARLLGKPLWLQVHGLEAWEAPSRAVRKGVESARLVTSVSRYTRRCMLSWAAIDPARIRVLPNTFKTSVVEEIPAASSKIVSMIAGRPYILTVSRINRCDAYKGHDRVIQVLPRLRSLHPDLVYVIAGTGDGRVGLETLAQNEGVLDMLVFTGHVPDEQLAALMRGARAFVMPSTREGFGIVFLEAASCGVSVIGGNRDGSVDALADGALGTLIDPDDPDQILKAISSAVTGLDEPPPGSSIKRFERQRFNAHVAGLLALLSSPSKPQNPPSK